MEKTSVFFCVEDDILSINLEIIVIVVLKFRTNFWCFFYCEIVSAFPNIFFSFGMNIPFLSEKMLRNELYIFSKVMNLLICLYSAIILSFVWHWKLVQNVFSVQHFNCTKFNVKKNRRSICGFMGNTESVRFTFHISHFSLQCIPSPISKLVSFVLLFLPHCLFVFRASIN